MRSPLEIDGYRPRFSGHETFPLRYGWLKKAYDLAIDRGGTSAAFRDQAAIARLGVGKNMVAAIRHWAVAAGVLSDSDGLQPTALGHLIYADDGLDPWMEDPSTAWLAHWRIAARPELTTWYWSFNHYSALAFERDSLIRGLVELSARKSWRRASPATIRRDVGCLVRSYAPPQLTASETFDDALESPLAEIGVIRASGGRDRFRFIRGAKPTLKLGALCCAITEFWEAYSPNSRSLSFEALAHAPGSPGRVFVLGEEDLVNLLSQIDDHSCGAYRWSETAGLRQLFRSRRITEAEAMDLIGADYRPEIH